MTETTISMHQQLLVKGTRERQRKEINTKKEIQQLSCFSHLKKWEIGHERTKDKSTSEEKQKQKLQDNTHPLSTLPHTVINQPLCTYPIPPPFVITTKWT